jgi:hypothetical protein
MRALAEFVMRGRAQAIAVAIVSTAIPMLFWIGAAVVALVTLRRGPYEGALIVMWAALPGAVAAWFGEIMPLSLLLGALALAALLRASASWPWTLCGAALLGMLLSAGLMMFGGDYLAVVEKMFAELVAAMQKQAADGTSITPPGRTEIAGIFGLIDSVMLVVSLILARSWQAALYNPGGFGTEFRALRLGPAQVVGLMVAAMGTIALGASYRYWAWIPLVPMLFAGLGLVHAIAATRGRLGIMGLFYVALLLLPPVKQIVVMLAAVDGWLDIRRRWLQPPIG